jgi:uncharacterized membrane protein
VFILIVGLLIFLGIHSIRIVAPEWRDRRIAAIGEGPWKGLYTLISLVGLVLVIWGYSRARAVAPVLYEPPVWTKHIAVTLMLFAFVSLAVSLLPAGRLKPALKHPMLVSVKIWALAHLLANGDVASLLLFATFLLWAVVDRISVKRRGEGVPVRGPAIWDFAAIASGALLYVLFVWRLHEWLIGAPPIP